MAKMKPVDWAATVLVLVGALNWGLVGLLDFNLVTYLTSVFGDFSGAVARVLYIVVGASAVYSAIALSTQRKSKGRN